jgi:hypothetical protein
MTDSVFHDCDLFVIGEQESFRHTSPIDALVEWIGDVYGPDVVIDDINYACVVVGYKRRVVSYEEMRSWAKDLAFNLIEKFDEEYGPSDECGQPSTNAHAIEELMLPAVKSFVAGQKVWQCERFAEKVYTSEMIRAAMTDSVMRRDAASIHAAYGAKGDF